MPHRGEQGSNYIKRSRSEGCKPGEGGLASSTMNENQLLQEAERCYRLARGIPDRRLSEELEAIGRQFEREAQECRRALEDAGAAAHRAPVGAHAL